MSMSAPRPLMVVPGGPRAFRSKIRRVGPLASLAPAAVLGVLAWRLLADNDATGRGIAGFAAAVFAAPALMPFGVPLAEGSTPLFAGALVSAIGWLAIGVIAARRATRSPVATWRDFWREWVWLASGAWLGVTVGLIAVRLAVGGIVV